MTVTGSLAAFASALSWPAVPAPIGAKVLDHLLDTLGVMCAGVSAPQTRAIAALQSPTADRNSATVIGSARRLAARDAAFTNTFAGRIHTFDDTLEAGPVHPGSPVIATALATAEAVGASGVDLLRGVLAGYEVAARVSLGLGASHYARGFHNTGTCNAFAAAAAAAAVRGLDADRIRDALGIAGGMASGIRQHQIDGAMSDSALNGAHAALAGVLAAELAAAGLSGPPGILDGKLGFGALTADAPDYSGMVEGLGRDWRFASMAIKPYPTCRFTHGPVRVALDLRAAHDLKPEHITRIEIATFRQSIEVSDRPAFPTRTLALLSHQHVIAAALVRGRFALADLDDAAIADPDVRALAARVSVVHDAALEARYPQAWPHRIRITLDDGRTLEATSDNPPGGANQPLSRGEVLGKLSDNATPLLGAQRVRALATEVLDLEHRPDVRALGRLLAAASDPAQAAE